MTSEDISTNKIGNESPTEIQIEQKKFTPKFDRESSNKKTYGQIREFIEEGMLLQANYQLVMLKYLVAHKIAHKGQIAEELAFYNNQDNSDIEVIKKFFKVPVYEVLEKRGFVRTEITHYDGVQFLLNANLNEYQTIELLDLLEKKIEEYNNKHGIPHNTTSLSDGIDWWEHTDLLAGHKVEQRTKELVWIWSVTPENWEILKNKNVWGSRITKNKIQERVKDGDYVVFYVVSTGSFKGIFKFVGNWFDAKEPIWFDEKHSIIYISRINLIPVKLGSVKVYDLGEKLDIFKGKNTQNLNLVLKGGNGYPSNNGNPITNADLEIIKNEMRNDENNFELTKTKSLAKPGVVDQPSYKILDPLIDTQKSPHKLNFEANTQSKISEVGDKIYVENDPSGVVITRIKIIDKEIIRKGQILTNDELVEKFGVGNMGGIRFSKKNNVIILCSTLSGDYSDEINEKSREIFYTGEGQIGKQELTGGNYMIAHSQYIPMLFFKEVPQEPGSRKRGALDNLYKFVGKVHHIYHFYTAGTNKSGQSGKVIKFQLRIEK